MRVVFACAPAYGHLHPLLPLALALADGGDEVAVATCGGLLASVEAAGLAPIDAGPPLEAWWSELGRRAGGEPGDGLPIERILPYYVPRLFADIGAHSMLDPLVAAAEAADLVVFETYALAAPLAARIAGVPAVHHLLGPAIPTEAMVLAGDALSPLWRHHNQPYPAYGGVYEVPTVAICPPSLGLGEVPPGTELLAMRPVAHDTAGQAGLPEWAADLPKRPTVYVTLGTVTNQDHGVFRAVLDGLGAESLNVVVTVGKNNDPAGLGPLPPNTRAEGYIPQSLLLPRCDAVISHGGSGTMLATLSHGLPSLMIPQGADQYVNAECCVAAGVADRLLPDEVGPGPIRERVLAMLEDGPVRQSAGRARAEIQTMPAPAEVAATLHRRFGG